MTTKYEPKSGRTASIFILRGMTLLIVLFKTRVRRVVPLSGTDFNSFQIKGFKKSNKSTPILGDHMSINGEGTPSSNESSKAKIVFIYFIVLICFAALLKPPT